MQKKMKEMVMKMKIEVLFPEIANLYGDLFNVEFLRRSYSGIEIVNTSLTSQPLFASEKPAMIFMGSVTERGQELACEKLLPYRDRLSNLVNDDVIILLTGNGTEIFGSRIELEDGSNIKCLDIVPTYAKRQMDKRYNSLYLGKFNDMDIVGFKSQFSHSYGDNSDCYLFDTIKGDGLNPDVKNEGIRIHNLFSTYLIGPLLVLNPPFAKHIMQLMGIKDPLLQFEQECFDAYEARIKEFSEPDKKILG